MTKNDNKRKRGRPPTEGEKFVQTAFRMKQEQLDWLDKESVKRGLNGRNALVRLLVDKARGK